MGKSADVPPAPDYRGAAADTAAASKELATQQNYANRPTQNTPWGSTYWTQGTQTDPATGQPVTSWTQNQQLDPALQGALADQLAMQGQRTDLASGFMGRVGDAYSQPFNWSNLPSSAPTPQQQYTQGRDMQTNLPAYALDASRIGPTTGTTNEPAFAAERQRIEQGLFDRMRPEQQFQEDRTRTMLANQGLTPGSEAYDQELGRLQQQQAGERWNALQMGGAEQQRMQQMLMGQQQQAFTQQGASQQAQNEALARQQAMLQASGQFYNTAQQQMFNQDLGANAQNYGQSLSASEYQQRLRQQAIAEQAQQRGMPLNEMNALLSGQQVGSPSMPQFATAQAGAAPNYLSAAQMQGQSGIDAYNAGQLGQQGLMSGLFGLGAATSKYWWPALFGAGGGTGG